MRLELRRCPRSRCRTVTLIIGELHSAHGDVFQFSVECSKEETLKEAVGN